MNRCQSSNRQDIRPKRNLVSNQLVKGHIDVVDSDADSEREDEGRPIKGQKAIYMPSKEEWDNHMRTHIPFRKWCPFCVRGKCMAGAHKSSNKTDEDKEREKATICLDYMKQKSSDGKQRQIAKTNRLSSYHCVNRCKEEVALSSYGSA